MISVVTVWHFQGQSMSVGFGVYTCALRICTEFIKMVCRIFSFLVQNSDNPKCYIKNVWTYQLRIYWVDACMHVWSRKTTFRSHSGPQAAVETSTWPVSPSVDASTGSRHRTRHRCRMGHSQCSSSMEGHRRSSGPMNEWMNACTWVMHEILWMVEFLALFKQLAYYFTAV